MHGRFRVCTRFDGFDAVERGSCVIEHAGGGVDESIYTLEWSADAVEEGDEADTAAATGLEEWICSVEERAGALEKSIAELENSSVAVPPSMNTSAWQARSGLTEPEAGGSGFRCDGAWFGC